LYEICTRETNLLERAQERKKMKCPSCHGCGGETVPILDYGQGPFEECPYCNGSGEIKNRKHFYRVLGYQSGYKRWRRKMRERNAPAKILNASANIIQQTNEGATLNG